MNQMDYKEFYRKLCECGILSDHWKHLLELLAVELTDNQDRNGFLKLFTLYFSLIDDGNVYLSLRKDELKRKIEEKINQQKIQITEDTENEKENPILEEIISELNEIYGVLEKVRGIPFVEQEGDSGNRLFVISDNRLFTRKYWNAVSSIRNSAKRIFQSELVDAKELDSTLLGKFNIQLTDGQKEIVDKGIRKNLLVTGGPGTGKTTSVFFLLMSLLKENPFYSIYLTAPSGKAASRMKDSILESAGYVKKDAEGVETIINTIKNLEEYTIHRLLSIDYSNHGFKYNKNNQFPKASIFVIDEASMIDVCVFASLLEAIPDGARVFILGDKDQLPSVECGAVFGELLKWKDIDSAQKVRLTESRRFLKESEIYKLAEAVNNPTIELPVREEDWKPATDFHVELPKNEKSNNDKERKEEAKEDLETEPKKRNPIFYFRDQNVQGRKIFDEIAKKWFEGFYSELNEKCNEIEYDEGELIKIVIDPSDGHEEDKGILSEIYSISENARILCANKETARGTKHINRFIIEHYYKGKKQISGFYPGELLMVTRNNDPLNLYNGDNGVAMKFKDDETLYIMFKKSTKLNLDAVNKETKENKIFRLGDYVFYPARLISREDVDPSFAITIHKSQGSDYKNILVILPEKKGHPLLNRQIVYTAVTRTKGSTYILSNQENMECARDTVLERDTGIIR